MGRQISLIPGIFDSRRLLVSGSVVSFEVGRKRKKEKSVQWARDVMSSWSWRLGWMDRIPLA
jgi:hypothetical protein